MKTFFRVAYFLFCVATAMIGHQIGNGWFSTILNFIFAPISWAKWMVCHDVNISIIKSAFVFFLN